MSRRSPNVEEEKVHWRIEIMCRVAEVVRNAQNILLWRKNWLVNIFKGLVAIGECGAARMARRKWLLEKKVRRHFHNPLDSPGLMLRRRDGYLKRRFVIISTIPMAIAKIGCGPSNFHLQAILWEMIKCIREWSTRLMVQSAVFLVVRTLGSLRWWRMLRTFCCGGKTDWSTFSWGTTWYQLYAFAMHFPFLHRSLSPE